MHLPKVEVIPLMSVSSNGPTTKKKKNTLHLAANVQLFYSNAGCFIAVVNKMHAVAKGTVCIMTAKSLFWTGGNFAMFQFLFVKPSCI